MILKATILKEKLRLEIIKKIKKKLSNKNISFTPCITAIIVNFIFKSIPKINKLNICIPVIFDSKQLFNNHGGIFIHVKRENLKDNINDFIIYINKLIIKNKKMGLQSYYILNIANFNLNIYNNVDVIITGFPISNLNKLDNINNSLKSVNIYNYFSGVSIYCCYLGNENFVDLTFSIRTQLNLDILIKNIENLNLS